MSLVVPNTGEQDMLEAFLSAEDFILKLYTNNETPALGSEAASFTEADGAGYAAKTLTGAGWTIEVGNPTIALYAEQSFAFSGALGNVYGYYLVGATTGRIKWAERFANGPYNVQAAGDVIKVTPRFTARSQQQA